MRALTMASADAQVCRAVVAVPSCGGSIPLRGLAAVASRPQDQRFAKCKMQKKDATMMLREFWRGLLQLAQPVGLALLLGFACQPAHSQALGTPPANAARPQSSPPLGNNLRGGGGAKRETHRDALGNQCLAVAPLARPHAANSNVYDHVLVLDNQCLKWIKTRACYTESDQCVEADVPGLTRQDVILGISSMIKFFSYELHEF